jgi:hypothetical protein
MLQVNKQTSRSQNNFIIYYPAVISRNFGCYNQEETAAQGSKYTSASQVQARLID